MAAADRHLVASRSRERAAEEPVGAADVAEVARVEERPPPASPRPSCPSAGTSPCWRRPRSARGSCGCRRPRRTRRCRRAACGCPAGRKVPSGSARTIRSPAGLEQPAPGRVAVALLGLVDDPRASVLATSSLCPCLGVVVDHEDLVDDAGGEEAVDDLADRALLRVGHQSDGDFLATPHRRARLPAGPSRVVSVASCRPRRRSPASASPAPRGASTRPGSATSPPTRSPSPTWARAACSTSAAASATATSCLAPRETVGVDVDPGALAGQDRETVVADMRVAALRGRQLRLDRRGPVDRARARPRAGAGRGGAGAASPTASLSSSPRTA